MRRYRDGNQGLGALIWTYKTAVVTGTGLFGLLVSTCTMNLVNALDTDF